MKLTLLHDQGIAVHPNSVLIKMSTVKTSRKTTNGQSSLATLHSDTFEKYCNQLKQMLKASVHGSEFFLENVLPLQ